MYLFVFRKILNQTIHTENFEEDNQECIHLFSKSFSIKQYGSKILKTISENLFNCFPKDSLSNNTYPKF